MGPREKREKKMRLKAVIAVLVAALRKRKERRGFLEGRKRQIRGGDGSSDGNASHRTRK